MFRKIPRLPDVAPQDEWKVWYQDTFDRSAPRRVEAEGRGLTAGLVELWARHLFETVQADGGRGFSRFNLWWTQESTSVTVVGPEPGMIRLRGWVFGEQRQARRGYVAAADKRLLTRVAALHGHLLLAGQSSEPILAAASTSADRRAFEAELARLEQEIRS